MNAKLRTHVVIAPDAGDGELERGNIDKHVAAVLAQLAIFVVRELAIIVARVVSGREHIHNFSRPNRHNWLQHHSIDQRENGRVNANGQRKRQYRDGSESRRLQKLPQSKPEILHHNDCSPFSLRCSLVPFLDSTVVRPTNILASRTVVFIAQ